MDFLGEVPVSIGREENLELAHTTVKKTKVYLNPGISYLHNLNLIASIKNSSRAFSGVALCFSHVICAVFK